MTQPIPKQIGLIVAKPFGYSETFYLADIKVWQELGHEVQIFPIQSGTAHGHADFTFNLPPDPLSHNLIKRVLQVLSTCMAFLFGPSSLPQLYQFIKLERQAQIKLRQIFAKIYANQHVLKSQGLDLIVFGYGNLAITRENLGKALNANTIVSFKGADISIFPFQSEQPIYDTLFKQSFLFYFVSEGLHQKAKKWGFPPQKKAWYIPAYIDESVMPYPKEDFTINNPPQIIAVGRLHWKKAHIYLILALRLLHKANVKAELKIVGDGELYEQLFWAARELELDEWVHFEGALDREGVFKAMKSSDILVHPSLSEGTPNVVLEAQYLGLPCIVANWPGADELITHNWNGWIVATRNPEALAQQIRHILDIGEVEKQTVIQNGKMNVQHQFNAQVQKINFQKLFEATTGDE